MMDAAYFVGRQQLLSFFNDLLDLNLTKIEQTASGAVACQLTEIIFPGSVPMSRVNWEARIPSQDAVSNDCQIHSFSSPNTILTSVLSPLLSRSDYEFVNNYKLLQAAFTKHAVQRHVDVDKLIRAKYQDNLEFCQWLKAFYDQSGAAPSDGYDAKAVRAKGKGGKKYNDTMTKGGGAGGRRTVSSSNTRRVTAAPRVAARATTKPRVPARNPPPTKKGPLKPKSSENNNRVAVTNKSKAANLAASAEADA
ncbi:MAG: hypothetical protein SGARI_002145, partial [Bacillariaceae sp.]